MAIPRTTARKLVSETEFNLINESFPPLVGNLSGKGLLQRMERARKARDRYHMQVERQQGKAASGSRRGAAPAANLKEVISKERLFEETLARFERRTAQVNGSDSMKADAVKLKRNEMGKKSGAAKSGAQAKSKASVKMANKAAAKSGKAPAPKAAKGKGGATKRTPRGRNRAMTASTTLH
ncbi:hypothetical protein [Noviherbaspirillum massiliense]|uniref:hypothetical protein n=1 Tax=Noviherbaspirillum massiliense TaxID=1465823 RepID=UPI0002DCE06B|nr:hypothetical protein [Noviherbaspirillum massiliense]